MKPPSEPWTTYEEPKSSTASITSEHGTSTVPHLVSPPEHPVSQVSATKPRPHAVASPGRKATCEPPVGVITNWWWRGVGL